MPEIAINNPPSNNEKVRIFNQMTETHKIRDLATMIVKKTGCGIDNVKTQKGKS